LGAITFAVLALTAGPAFAVTTANLYVVPSGGASSGSYPSVCTQSDPCTLGWALDQSNSTTDVNGDDVVINLAPGTYAGANTIDSTMGAAPAMVELLGEGSGPAATVLSGGGTAQTMYVDNVNYEVSIQNLTLEDGYTTSNYGANLLVDTGASAEVVLDDDIVTGGWSVPGGQADVTGGKLALDNTTVENSVHDTFGSDTRNAGILQIDNSTYSGNSNTGVINTGSGAVSVSTSTIAGNTGYGVESDGTGPTTVVFSTVAGNTQDGLYETTGTLGVYGSIVAGNDVHACGGAVTVYFDNVGDDSTCGFSTSNSSEVVTTNQIGLLPLADNGGLTETMRITPASAAYDIVPTSLVTCNLDDQRGIPYLQGSASVCDAGAYQYAPPTLSLVSPTSEEPGSPGEIQLTGTNLLNASVSFGSGGVPGTVINPSLTTLEVAMPLAAILPLGSEPITVTNADGSATLPFTATGPTIGTLPATVAEVDHPYSETFPISNYESPDTFSLASGMLPAGLTLSSSGKISGTPTAAGTSSFTVKNTDGFGVVVTSPESITVLAPTIRLASSRALLSSGGAQVQLHCGTDVCSGSGVLTMTERVKVKTGKKRKKGTKTKTKTEKIVLASGSYDVSANSTGEVILELSKAGARERGLLRHSRGSASATVSFTLLGGTEVTARVKLSG
jgi:hypothetical protein